MYNWHDLHDWYDKYEMCDLYDTGGIGEALGEGYWQAGKWPKILREFSKYFLTSILIGV